MSTYELYIDESYDNAQRCMAVGGFWLPCEGVNDTMRRLEEVKDKFGLVVRDEIKWSLGQGHPTRKKLDCGKVDWKTVRERLFLAICRLEWLTFVVIIMRDVRNLDKWKTSVWKKAGLEDFYCEAVRYFLQRAAEEAELSGWSRAMLICDQPNLGGQRFQHGSIYRGPQALFEAYKEWYERGVGMGPGRQRSSRPLKALRFDAAPYLSRAADHPLLQVADLVVGATLRLFLNERFARSSLVRYGLSLRLRRRYGHPGFWGDGLTVHPQVEIPSHCLGVALSSYMPFPRGSSLGPLNELPDSKEETKGSHHN